MHVIRSDIAVNRGKIVYPPVKVVIELRSCVSKVT